MKTCEVTGKHYAVFLNLAGDSFSSGQKHLSGIEVDLLTAVFENIILSNSKSITLIQALNLTSRLKGSITKDVAQQKINHWTKTGYLAEQNGLLCFGPRAIGEFDVYLKGQYANRITKCKLCIDTVYFVSLNYEILLFYLLESFRVKFAPTAMTFFTIIAFPSI